MSRSLVCEGDEGVGGGASGISAVPGLTGVEDPSSCSSSSGLPVASSSHESATGAFLDLDAVPVDRCSLPKDDATPRDESFDMVEVRLRWQRRQVVRERGKGGVR